MTNSPFAPRLGFDDLEDAVRALRERGLRLSTARWLVLEALFGADGPVSAAHLARTLRVEESSVYRNLWVLERYGLVRHGHLGHGPGLYLLVGREEAECLYWQQCAKVTFVSPEQLEPVRDQIQRRFGYVARFTHFAIVGLCERCASREPNSDSDSAGRIGAPTAMATSSTPIRTSTPGPRTITATELAQDASALGLATRPSWNHRPSRICSSARRSAPDH